MTLPLATLDHVVINARDDMDRAAERLAQLRQRALKRPVPCWNLAKQGIPSWSS